jgi:polar amino acid transport system permease protein
MQEFGANHAFFIIKAAQWTILLSVVAFIGGGILGLFVALCRTAHSSSIRLISGAYVALIQGTPILVILFLSYFGLSIIGYDTSAFAAASLSMTIYTAAFLGETWRGCIESVPKTQWEAADCVGLNQFQLYRHVILPQAMRIAIPPTVGFMVQIVKNTSLASIIGFIELTRAGQLVNNATFQPFTTFVVVGLIYLALCYPLSEASRYFERKLNVAHR